MGIFGSSCYSAFEMPLPIPVLLMVRSLGVGGTERQLTETARFLDRSLFAPHVACLSAQGMRLDELQTSEVPLLQIPVSSFLSLSVLRGHRVLQHYIRRRRIQLVHTFDVPMNLFGVPSSRLGGSPVVLSSQRAHRELTPFAGRQLLRVTDRIADGIVVNCEAMRRHLEQDEGVPARKLHICYNGIDTKVYHPAPAERPEMLRGGPVIGVVCALRPEKGLDTLLKAFAAILPQYPDARLAIVGSGSEETALQQMAASLGIGNATHFEPATRKVAEWLRCIDIFVLPSLSEALSNSLMEAMACGCCPVASEVGGNPELVIDGRTGLLFPPGNAPALAARLRDLVGNESARRNMAAAAATRIATDFTHRAAATRMGEIYTGSLRRKISDSSFTLAVR